MEILQLFGLPVASGFVSSRFIYKKSLMTRSVYCLCLLFSCFTCFSQDITGRLETALKAFENDPQLSTALVSLYVVDGKSGKVILDRNSRTGLAPASTQKIITSISAYELLGADFVYSTRFVHEKTGGRDVIRVYPSGDPTFGSPRYTATKPALIAAQLKNKMREAGIIRPQFLLADSLFETQRIPDGWIWQDVGNYYGAGAGAFNWKENQADLLLQSGEKPGDPVTVKNYAALFPGVSASSLVNELRTAAKGTGDNAYYYFGHGNRPGSQAFLKGTIPAGEKNFSISIALADPWAVFLQELQVESGSGADPGRINLTQGKELMVQTSPSLDSIIYWFNKKSINLYGEALMKAIGAKEAGVGAADKGIAVLQEFWGDKGISKHELNMYDGSGLSPLNRITTHAQVTMLQFAKTRPWFAAFYDALPLYNNMKLKSGTISDVKGFCGYHRAADGSEYVISFLVNNYNGRASELVNKMYKVLNVLK